MAREPNADPIAGRAAGRATDRDADASTDLAPRHAFPPIEGRVARVLILGSMPGIASLEAARYYAHPRNAFWPIIMTLLDEATATPASGAGELLPAHEVRVRRLHEQGIALWDVLAECVRPGSLDAAIRRESERANDVPALCARHPELELIAFNGQTAAKLFERHVGAAVRAIRPGIGRVTLPSTSPAHASLGLAGKRDRWRDAIGPYLHGH